MVILTIFVKCVDYEASVVTFVANLFLMLDNADSLKRFNLT